MAVIILYCLWLCRNVFTLLSKRLTPFCSSVSSFFSMHGASQTNTPQPFPQPHQHHHNYHHHLQHHSKRRRSSHFHRSMSGLTTSPPMTPVKLTKGHGASPPPSAPPIFSGSPGFVFGSFEDRGFLGGPALSEGGTQAQSHGPDTELEDGAFPSSSPLLEEAGLPGSPPLTGSQRHSVSPVRITGAANSGSSRRLSETEMGSPPGGKGFNS